MDLINNYVYHNIEFFIYYYLLVVVHTGECFKQAKELFQIGLLIRPKHLHANTSTIKQINSC